MHYNIIIDKDSESDWWASVPSLPGCFSSGETLEQLRQNVKDAIRAHIEALTAEGLPVPPPDSELFDSIEVA